MKKLGVIGAGHMAGALVEGLLKANHIPADQIVISGGKSLKAKALAEKWGCTFASSNMEVAQSCETLILGVTPKVMPEVLKEIKSSITPNQLLISIASSFTYAQFDELLPPKTQLLRTIPNLPVAVNAGITAIANSTSVSAAKMNEALALFNAVGTTLVLDESQLATASAVAGCSPAFYAIFIEALADAGVLYGLKRADAYQLATQAALGTAKTLLSSGMLPAALKDDVASPGGVTIKGIAALEKYGLRNAVIESVKAAAGD